MPTQPQTYAIPTAVPNTTPMVPVSQTAVPMGVPVNQPAMPASAPAVVVAQPTAGTIHAGLPAQQTVVLGYDPFNTLMSLNGVIVEQKPQYIEGLTGYQQENVYYIYPLSADGKVTDNMPLLFIAKETSECCTRQCCTNDRPFELDVLTPANQTILHVVRPFKCQCCCFNLPEISVYFPNDLNTPIGSCKNKFSCFNDLFTIYDNQEMPLLTIHGECCQLSKFCFCPMEGCNTIHFDIFNQRTNQQGLIDKKWSSCVREAFSNADTFVVVFPPQSTLAERVLILASTFLIDFMYFEQNDDQDTTNDYSR